MDVSVNPVLESVRPFFQGLPVPANNPGASPQQPASVPAPPPSHPAAATPVQPSPHGPPASSPSVLSYWPQPQRTKDKSPALASPLHHVYNGTKLSEPQQPSAQHNLPPIAALSSNYHSRTVLRQTLPAHPPSSESPRTSLSQFRTPDYPQSNHHSIYSPPSSQSISRSSSGSSFQSMSKYQAPGSPAVSSPSPHPYSYSPRTSLPMSSATTLSSPAYPQTTSASPVYVSSSHHQKQQYHSSPSPNQQNRPPSNHQLPSHHPMSPVIQQPSQSQSENTLPKLHQPSSELHQSIAHQQPPGGNLQYSSSHPQQLSNQHHPGQQIQSNSLQQQPRSHQQQALGNQQQLSSYHQLTSPLQKDPNSHIHHSSSHQQNPPSNQQHPGTVQHTSSHQQHSSNHPQHPSNQQQHASTIQQHSSHLQQPNSNQHRSSTPQHHSSIHQQLSNVSQQHSNNQQSIAHQQNLTSNLQHAPDQLQSSYPQHSANQQQSGDMQGKPLPQYQHINSNQQHSVPARPPSHPNQHPNNHQQQSSSQQQQQSITNYQQQQKSLSQHQQNHAQQMLHHQQAQQARHDQQNQQTSLSHQQRQHMLSQQHHHQLQQQAAMYNQTVQQNSTRPQQQQQQQQQTQQTQQQQQQQHQRDTEKLAEMEQMLRLKQRQLAAVQAQQQAYYAAVSSNSSRPPSQTSTTTTEASNHQRTTPTQALMGGIKRESPLDLSVKTVRQSADSTAKDDAESAYYANIQSHEAFLHRSKPSPKTASPRSSVPPLQLPSTIVYPHFDNHAVNQNSNSGAPKVDFLPNFNAHHSSASTNSGNFQDQNKRQRKSSTSQHPSSSQYPPRIGSLPHMGSFKRSSLPSAAYDDPNKQSQYYPATGPPNMQRSTAAMPNHSSLNLQPSFGTTASNQYSYDPLKRGSSAMYDIMERHSSSSSLQSSSSLESNYLLGKRQSSSTDLRHPLPPKIPKVVDTWRQTIDQQIEQRLNSYASSRGHQINGISKESSLPNSSGAHQQTASPYSSASKVQTSHSIATLPSSNSLIRSSSLFSSQLQNSSKTNLPSQHYSHSPHLSQYMSQSMPQRSSQEPYNNLAQVKLPSLPNNGAADKRVLSILRKRLDTREATNQLVQQQAQQASLQERSKMYSSMGSRGYPQPLVVPTPQSKYPPQAPHGRHNLPPFNALNLERNTAITYPSQKLHIPKAMDSVVHDPPQGHFPLRTDVIPRSPLAPRTEVSGKPGASENAGDFDGLAAFLAARIRTKAELKQVGPSMDPQNHQRTPTPASASTSPRVTPAVFSPPLHYPPGIADLGKRTPTSESGASSSGLSGSSPLKNSRDKYGMNSPRRRLFGELGTGGPSESVVQAREAGLRSSSETSVFDFRESDSEGETGLERQSLTDMRKDRDRRLQERQHVPATSPGLLEVCDSEPIDDSFWSGMCDQFVTQLEKGGNKVRKRGRRKKVDTVPEYETFETTEDALRAFYDIKPEEISTVIVKPEEASDAITKAAEAPSVITKVEESVIKQEESGITDFEVNKIKLEKVEDYEEMQNEEIIPEEESLPTFQKIKIEEESSDEDAPLSLRQFELKKSFVRLETSLEKDCLIKKDSEKDKLCIEMDKTKTDDFKCENIKQKAIKKEITDSEAESSADENTESVAKRLRMRKPKEESSKETKRKTRSKEKETSEKDNSLDRTSPQKGGRKKKEKEEKKKSFFGDGSEFRPGWEAEVYRYKRSLRMPTSLINIAGPQSWPSPKLSVSLPDLDPDSPMTLDSEISMQNKKMESDGESTPRKSKSPFLVKNKASQNKGEEKSAKEGEQDSFLNRLIQRYGGKGKKALRKGLDKDSSKERKGPKTIPQSNELQLLPTPSLDCIMKSSPLKKDQAQTKQSKGKKISKEEDKSDENEIKESIFLGYFRKKTVADFSNVFAKHNGGFATEHELPPIMLKSRTRTQTRILTQRATIREVFGEDRPASAPPAGCREDLEENDKISEEKKSEKPGKKSKALLNKRNSTNGITSGTRSGLRSAAVLRSNKAVLKSKQQLLHGGERRKRSKDLIKAFKTSKKHQQETKIKEETEVEPTIKCEPQETLPKDEVPVLVVNEKRLKYRSVRRKLKSSGFDYIRKKKKQQQKKDGDSESVKDKKKSTTPKQNLESEEDIQNEIKGWVINKGLGETILHRAARLGYTDIAAYCLEKMDHNPSPRDNAGYTPLHEACSKGRLDIARLLLLYGADVSDSAQGGIRPLHEAAENGCLELIRLLLSYGADPLLATYSGLTPLSLTYNHPEARTLLQHHLSDVQGLLAPPWQIQLTDVTLLGNNSLEGPPSPEPCESEVEVEAAELSLPHLYQLLGEPHADRWVLFQELCPVLRVKTREALIKQLGPSHRGDFRDLKMTEFYDMAHCCSVLGVGDFVLNPKAHKVTLVKYSERVRALLNSEKTVITR